jgi:hypothetical protein
MFRVMVSMSFVGALGFLLALFFPANMAQAEDASAITTCATSGRIVPVDAYACKHTPDVYKARIYEQGFCKSDPMSTGTFSAETCNKVFENPAGFVVDIVAAMQKSVPLEGTFTSAPSGSYGFPYIWMSHLITMKNQVTSDGTTYYSDEFGSATTNEAAFSEYMVDSTSTSTLETQCDGEYLNTAFAAGKVDAYLVNAAGRALTAADGVNIENRWECVGRQAFIGVITLDEPIVITDETSSLTLEFAVTDNGGSAREDISGPYANDGVPEGFTTSPFIINFIVE